MNSRSRNVLLAGLGVIVLMALFPPWLRCELRWIQAPNSNAYEGAIYTRSAGYGFVLEPPEVSTGSGANSDTSFIDMPRLVIQWVIVAAISLAVVAFQNGRARPSLPANPAAS